MRKILRLIGAALLSLTITLSVALPSFAYEVKPGDTLSKIARENNTTVMDLVSINKISNPNKIFVGQTISLSLSSSNLTLKPVLTEKDKAMLKSMFDAIYYAIKYPDVVKVYGSTEDELFKHFCEYGLLETRQPNANFNVNAYASAYGDLYKAFGDDVLAYYKHYNERGKIEGRKYTTIEKALTVVDKIKSVSPLNKPDSKEKMFGTIVAKSNDNFEPNPTLAPAPSSNTVDLWARRIVESYENTVLSFAGYLDSIDGGDRFAFVEASLNSEDNRVGNGRRMRTLSSFYGELVVIAENLKGEYPAKTAEIQDKLDSLDNYGENIANKVRTEAMTFSELNTLNEWCIENKPKRRDFDDAYIAVYEAWCDAYNSQDFTYEGQFVDDKLGIYGYASVDIYVSNEEALWETDEPKAEDFDDDEETYNALHAEWEAARPKAENYFIAKYETLDEATAARDEWLLLNPEPTNNSGTLYEYALDDFIEETANKLKALGIYVFELMKNLYRSDD